MARRKRSIKQHIAQHFGRRQQWYIPLLAIAAVVVVVVMGAQFLVDKEGDHKNVVKALSGTPDEKYQAALTAVNEGNLELGRLMMLRLARLGDTEEKPLGYGKAHLWIAEDTLANFKTDFIWDFPLESGQDEVKISMAIDSNSTQTQKHLQHAVILNPELQSAAILLAATYAAQNKRNLAIDVLVTAITHAQSPHIRLHIPLANILTSKGDDLALKEKAWHLFSSLGQEISAGREREVSLRVRYVLSALILRKYENAEIVIRRLEAQYPKTDTASGDRNSRYLSVRALRMAYHYHRAIHIFREISASSTKDYTEVVGELVKVIQIQPDCASAIGALSQIAKIDATQKEKIKNILQKVLSSESANQIHLKSRVSLALAMIEDVATNLRKEYLEIAIESDPENGEALLELAKVLVKEDDPDYARISKLTMEAMDGCRSDQRVECYRILGLAKLRLKNWNEAIVALEKALSGEGDKAEVHSLLAETYEAVGKSAIAVSHRKMAAVK